ncbi:oxidoreductase [Fadolivirus algeromassiliense]|jgi:predicted dehydrogenase|uniref:Oxidoreductase n=1 Tax=Fadolivirus FV1/VV64 TaxID=3070911 RepID=A0A7D3V813_9VIRU|nr:oxidoreductase [Fadolivirus algeromassiliense]QKF94836.1 oxidoreductase [Fadolivirus FV1/VV64]
MEEIVSNKKFNVFVVGCSVRAIALLSELKKASENELCVVGIHDRVNASLSPFLKNLKENNIKYAIDKAIGDNIDSNSGEHELPKYTVQTLQQIKPDLVMVCSINKYHADDIIVALDSGSNVFCEKPICTTINDALRILQTSIKAKKPIYSGFVLRHAPIWAHVKKILTGDDKRIGHVGNVLNISFNETLWKGHGVLARDGWRGHKDTSGGHWIEKLCHPIDLCDWFMNDIAIEAVSMSSTNYWLETKTTYDIHAKKNQDNYSLFTSYNGGDPSKNISRDPTYDVEDTFSGSIKYANGGLVSISSNTYSVSGQRMMSIECANHVTIHIEASNHKTQSIIVETRGFERGYPTEQTFSQIIEFPTAGCHGNGDKYIMQDLYNNITSIKINKMNTHSLEKRIEQTLDFIKSTILAIALEESSRDKKYYNFGPIWKDFGYSKRVEDYGYPHKEDEKTEWLQCISDIIYVPGYIFNGTYNKMIHNVKSVIELEMYHEYVNYLRTTAAFIIPYDGKYYYLMKHQKRGIDIAGGRREDTESAKECAVRELKEETGIDVHVNKLELCGVKFMICKHKLDKRFKYPSQSQNQFYTVKINPMSDEEYQKLQSAAGDASTGCVRFTFNELVLHQCFRVHQGFFYFIEEQYNK